MLCVFSDKVDQEVAKSRRQIGQKTGSICGPIFLAQFIERFFPIRSSSIWASVSYHCHLPNFYSTWHIVGAQLTLRDWKDDSTYHACHSTEQNAWDEVDNFLFCPSLMQSLTVEWRPVQLLSLEMAEDPPEVFFCWGSCYVSGIQHALT